MLDPFDLADSVDFNVWEVHILANVVGNQIDMMPKRGESFQTLVHADGSTTRLEERLRGEH
jgi:hypothetical protein